MRHTPTHSALPNWREPVAHPLTTRMSSNLGFRVINPLAPPTLGGTSCASDRVGWPNLSGAPARTCRGRPRARVAGVVRSIFGQEKRRWPEAATPAETQRREPCGEAPRRDSAARLLRWCRPFLAPTQKVGRRSLASEIFELAPEAAVLC